MDSHESTLGTHFLPLKSKLVTDNILTFTNVVTIRDMNRITLNCYNLLDDHFPASTLTCNRGFWRVLKTFFSKFLIKSFGILHENLVVLAVVSHVPDSTFQLTVHGKNIYERPTRAFEIINSPACNMCLACLWPLDHLVLQWCVILFYI